MAVAVPAGMLAGCSSSGGPLGSTTYVQAAAAMRIPVDAAQLRQAEAGSEALSLSLLRQFSSGNDNMIFSPQTIVDLFGMILPGASGQSATELSTALGAGGLGADTTAAALGKIDSSVRSDAQAGSNTFAESADVWGAKDLKFAQSYLAALDGAFNTGVHQADFVGDPDGARNAINNLVSQETHGYIPELFGQNSIGTTTRIVLTDAVYLDATWTEPFDPSNTSTGNFYPATGSTEQTSMMNQTAGFDYASGKGWQLAELPYTGGKLAMDVLLPAKGSGTLAALRNGLTVSSLTSMLGSMTRRQLDLAIPKFTTDYTPSALMQSLRTLGLGGLFDNFDLTGMTATGERLKVSEIVEKAHIAVSEHGTVAAAAAGAGGVGAAEAEPIAVPFIADHPFLYLIRDLSTGQILFAGQLAST